MQRHQVLSNSNRCDNCFRFFARNSNPPFVICHQSHTLCKLCLDDQAKGDPACPYCHETINFDKVVANQAIFQRLPREAAPAPVNGPTIVARSKDVYPPPAIPVHDAIDFKGDYEPVSGQDPSGKEPKVSAYPNQSPNAGLLGANQNVDEKNVISGVALIFALCLICCQLPFTVVNLVFAENQPHSVCMDTPHAGLAVRPWFFGIGITQIVLMVLLLLPILFYKGGCCQLPSLGAVFIFIYVLWAIKGLVWFIVELILFINGISKYCHGGVYTYGLILVILNGLGLLSGCCRACTGNNQ